MLIKGVWYDFSAIYSNLMRCIFEWSIQHASDIITIVKLSIYSHKIDHNRWTYCMCAGVSSTTLKSVQIEINMIIQLIATQRNGFHKKFFKCSTHKLTIYLLIVFTWIGFFGFTSLSASSITPTVVGITICPLNFVFVNALLSGTNNFHLIFSMEGEIILNKRLDYLLEMCSNVW